MFISIFRVSSLDSEVLVGTSELNSGSGQRYRVRNTISHDQFNGRYSFSYDIALVRLQTPIQFNDRVQAIKFSNKVIPENTRLLVSGFGQRWVSKDLDCTMHYLCVSF